MNKCISPQLLRREVGEPNRTKQEIVEIWFSFYNLKSTTIQETLTSLKSLIFFMNTLTSRIA